MPSNHLIVVVSIGASLQTLFQISGKGCGVLDFGAFCPKPERGVVRRLTRFGTVGKRTRNWISSSTRTLELAEFAESDRHQVSDEDRGGKRGG